MKKIYFVLFVLLSACSSVYKGDELPDLKGKSSADVVAILGKPVSERKETGCKMWAYHQQGCSTLVFFDGQDVVQYAEQRGNCSKLEEK